MSAEGEESSRSFTELPGDQLDGVPELLSKISANHGYEICDSDVRDDGFSLRITTTSGETSNRQIM